MAVKSPFSKKLNHVGIVVRDMDEAVKRLESLGIGPFKPFDPNSLPPFIGKPLYRGEPMEDIGCKVFVAKVGEVELEVFEPVKAGTPWKDFLDTKGEGVQHIAFTVDDLENEVARFTERGASVLLSGRWQGGGSVYLDLGVGDIIIELEQR